jgi:hypothetical protein
VGDQEYTNGGQNAGAVYEISGRTGATIRVMAASAAGTHLGRYVSAIDDLDGDGVRDIIAGSDHGLAMVFSGATGAFRYEVGFGGFGDTPVSGHGDVDGDGLGDFMISSWSTNPSGGAVRVYSGATGTLLYELSGQCDTGYLGFAITMLGDLDGDGHDEFAAFDVGRYRWHVWSGATGNELWLLPRRDITWMARTGDHNADGRDEALLGLGYALPNGRVQIVIDAVLTPTGTPTALGDGSGAACPCGNTGTPGAGCMNSSGVGAALRAFGSTSITENTLSLKSTGLPTGHTALLFYGTQVVNGGFGSPLGDGLRGAGGSVSRMFTKTTCSDPFVWGPRLAPFLQWNPGQEYVLQIWFRDNLGLCATGSNLTNAVRVTMTP